MNRRDLTELLAVRESPCVSIIMPMARKAPDDRQNPIRVKTAIRRATDRLEAEFPRRTVLAVADNLKALAETQGEQRFLDGLALFASPTVARRIDLPFAVAERIAIADGFATRELAHVLGQRYRVLVLGEGPVRILEGQGEHVRDVEREGMPSSPGGLAEAPGGGATGGALRGLEPVTSRDDHLKQLLHLIDGVLGERADADPLPLVIVGSDWQLARFEELSRHAGSIVAKLTGNHGLTSASVLGRMAWPLIEGLIRDRHRERAARELDAAIKQSKLASGLQEAWRAAREGRGSVLLVEESFRIPARAGATPENAGTLPATDAGTELATDLVDEVVDEVLRKHGDVAFVPDGLLAEHGRIALSLRYAVGEVPVPKAEAGREAA